MRRIKRTKITVIRTETVFLRLQDAGVAAAREILKLQSNEPERVETKLRFLDTEAKKGVEATDQGEVK